jgi:hypothetical protein
MRLGTNQILAAVALSIIGGCVAAYPIEDRRIGSYCASISAGSDVSDAVTSARSMFGVGVAQSAELNLVMVKSRFTFKTLCIIETSQSKVVRASFSSD